MLTSDSPQFVIYVLLRLFQIFVKVIADKNRGNTDLIFSTLRDISHNSWIEFYKKHVHYIKLYTDELSKTNEFKISEEHIIKERKCIITIEYSYPDNSEITGSKDVKLLNTKQNGTATSGIFKNVVHYFFGDPQRPPPQKNVSATQQAPEELKFRKIATETDAKIGSDPNNGNKDDGKIYANTESGTEDLTTDKEETLGSQQKEINDFCNNWCPPKQKNVYAIQPEEPKFATIATQTEAKTGSGSKNGNSDDDKIYENTESSREDLVTDKEETVRNQQKEINDSCNNRCPQPQKNVSAIQPEEPKFGKIAPGTDAKPESGSNNGTRDDVTKFSDTESGGEDLTTDKEETLGSHQEETNEPLTSTKPTNFSMDSEKNPNHTPEVPDGKNIKMEASDEMLNNDHRVSERSNSVENMPAPDQNEHANQDISEPTTSTKLNALFDNFFKEMETLKSPQLELTSDDSPDDTVNILNKEFQQVADEVSGIQERTRQMQAELENKKDKLEERNSILYTPQEEAVDTENEDFIEKLEEQKKKNEEELKRKREEREEKQRKLNEELREIRRLQKQKFAVLLQCIQLRCRFEEKEAEWSDWIEHCYRRLVVTVLTQFSDFLEELGRSEIVFRKVLERSPETVQSEITNLCGRMEATLNKLSRIFKNLAKIDEDFEDAVFIRILQKSSCDISTKLISVLNCLDAIEYSTEWYQELTSKFDHIRTSDVPGVTELKRLCKEDNWEGLKNIEFPKWEPRSHVKVEELSSDDDEDGMEDEPENLVEDNNDTSVEISVMTYTENSYETETKDPEQTSQLVQKFTECDSLISTNAELDEIEYFSDTDKKIESTTENQHNDEEEIKILINELLGKVEPSQSSIQEKSEQDRFQEAIHKQRPSEETVPIAKIEEFSSDKEEDNVEGKPDHLIETEKVEVFDINDSSNEVPEPDQRIPMDFLETWKDMNYPEISNAASNSDRSETKYPEQVDQIVCSVPTNVKFDEVENIAFKNAENTVYSQHYEVEEIKFLVDELIEKIEASQSFFQEKSELDGFQEAIAPIVEIEGFPKDEENIVTDKLEGFHKQISPKKTAPIAESEELSSEEDETVVEDKQKFDFNETSVESLDMIYPESSNGNETKDPEQADQVVLLVPESVSLDKEDYSCIDRNAKHTAPSEHDNEEEIGTPTNYLLEKDRDSQSPEKSKQDGIQEATPEVSRVQIYKQKTSKVTSSKNSECSCKKCAAHVNSVRGKTRVADLEEPSQEGSTSSEMPNKMNTSLSSTTQIDSTEIMENCLMLYDDLLTQRLNWDRRRHPMIITDSNCLNNKYPSHIVRKWNEIVKKETKFLDRQQIIELIKTKLKKLIDEF